MDTLLQQIEDLNSDSVLHNFRTYVVMLLVWFGGGGVSKALCSGERTQSKLICILWLTLIYSYGKTNKD